MRVLRFTPIGFRQWNVLRNGIVIAAITPGPEGLLLTVEGCGLSTMEAENISTFMASLNEDPVELARRQR